jgi:two-component system OmpR family response regulator
MAAKARNFAASDHPAGCLSSGQPGRILVIDDDPAMRDSIIHYFESHDWTAVGSDGSEAIGQFIDGGSFSLVVLDVQLGPRNGFDLLRQIRARSDIPVVILAGQHQDDIDRVVGLELGADDYMGKPFNPRELLARARATLRRHEMGRAARGESGARGGYRFSGWELNIKLRSLTNPSGQTVTLTKSEYGLLVAFLDAPGRTLSREQLLHSTRVHEDIFDRSIDVKVLRLRRKLSDAPALPLMIRTERGIGYTFLPSVEPFF